MYSFWKNVFVFREWDMKREFQSAFHERTEEKKWVSRGMVDRIWGNGPLHCTPLPPIISYTKLPMWICPLFLSLSHLLFSIFSLFSFASLLLLYCLSFQCYVARSSISLQTCPSHYSSPQPNPPKSPSIPQHSLARAHTFLALLLLHQFPSSFQAGHFKPASQWVNSFWGNQLALMIFYEIKGSGKFSK